jgi:hypothetical protein
MRGLCRGNGWCRGESCCSDGRWLRWLGRVLLLLGWEGRGVSLWGLYGSGRVTNDESMVVDERRMSDRGG